MSRARSLGGSVTVYFAFVSLLIIALLGALLEGALLGSLHVRLPQTIHTAAENVLAGYDRELFAEYGVMFRYVEDKSKLPALVAEYMRPECDVDFGRNGGHSQLLKLNPEQIYAEGLKATTAKGAFFVREVLELMKYQSVSELGNTILTMLQSYETSNSMNEMSEQEEANYNDTNWQELAGQLEQEGADIEGGTVPGESVGAVEEDVDEAIDGSIIGQIKRLLNETLLSIFLPGQSISKRAVAELPEWDEVWHNSKIEDPNLGFTEQLLFDEYIMSYFGNFVHQEGKPRLNYEQEFILIGDKSDIDNLTAVIGKLFAFRMGLNMVTIFASKEFYSQVESLAMLLVGWTGIVALIESVKIMLVSAWATSESILDVRALLAGQKVPIYKNSSKFTTGLADCVARAAAGDKARNDTGGIDYDMYMRMFLYLAGSDVVERTMQMIELNMKDKNDRFTFDKHIYGLKITVVARHKWLFSKAYAGFKPETPYAEMMSSMEVTY